MSEDFREKVIKKKLKKMENSFIELKKRKSIPVNTQFYNILRNITVSRDELMEEKQLDSGDWHLEFAKKVGDKKITVLFPRVKPEDRGSITKLGLRARKMMIASIGFAYVQESNSPAFPSRYILYFLGYEDEKQRGWMRDQFNRILVTVALASYIIENKDGAIEDIGQFVNRVRWIGKGINRYVIVEFNQPVVSAIFPEFFDGLEAETKLPADKRFVNYPLTRLVVTKKMRVYTENLLDYLIEFRQMGERFYEIKERTLVVKGMQMTPERIKHIGEANCSFALIEALMVAVKEKILMRFMPAYDIKEPKKGLDALVKLHFYEPKKMSYPERKTFREKIAKEKEKQTKREKEEIKEVISKDGLKREREEIERRARE